MAANIYDWSTTAANNANSDGDLTWAENQAPSTVNNSARVMMQRVKQLLVDLGGSIAAGGTANGLTVTANSAYTALADGQIVAFRASASNSGAATLNVNGIGSKAIRKMDSTGDVPLVANELRNTGLYIVQYSAALNGGAGAWLLVNPTLSAAIYALSGLTTVDNALARYDGTAGRLQNSNILLDDTGNLTFTAAAFSISGDTADASDTKSAALAGGGSASVNRGGIVVAYGNEHASFPGQVRLLAGTGGSILLNSDTTIQGTATATTFSGSGASLTNIPAGQLTGIVASARITGTYSNLTGTGALNAGSIASGFGPINIGASALTAGTGTFSGDVTTPINYRLSTSGNTTRLRYTTSGVATRFALRDDTLGSDVMSADTTGNVTFVGNVTASSDLKLKKHIRTISGALDLVKQLRGVRFTRRKVNTKSIGFIAQEVEGVFPELVHENETGKSVAYPNFVALLVEAVKELSAKVDKLERRK